MLNLPVYLGVGIGALLVIDLVVLALWLRGMARRLPEDERAQIAGRTARRALRLAILPLATLGVAWLFRGVLERYFEPHPTLPLVVGVCLGLAYSLAVITDKPDGDTDSHHPSAV